MELDRAIPLYRVVNNPNPLAATGAVMHARFKELR